MKYLQIRNSQNASDIILHLLVGSEVTLAFLSQVKMNTLKVAPLQANAMVYFKDMAEAARAVIAMRPLGAQATRDVTVIVR